MRMIESVSSAMTEQATAVTQISKATGDVRKQSEQTAKGMIEQSRAAAEISTATSSIARDLASALSANRDHSSATAGILDLLSQLELVTEESTAGVRDTTQKSEAFASRIRALHSPAQR
jgi:methyl-accepting chemotaxis protein